MDSYRWDIMGHLMLRNMEAVQKALTQLTPERDGVDGKAIYHYGEAWSFGEASSFSVNHLPACMFETLHYPHALPSTHRAHSPF